MYRNGTINRASPVASGSKSLSRVGDQIDSEERTLERFHSGVDEHVVHGLVNHLFANSYSPTDSATTGLISPRLTISLPYYPLDPPSLFELEISKKKSLEHSSSAKSLTLFHVPMVINTLPRSAWTLRIGNISRTDNLPAVREDARSLKVDPKITRLEIWTAELQWTLKFGSIATTSGISSPSLSYQAGKPIGTGGFDDWIHIGERRKVELVFTELENGESSDGGSNSNIDERKGKGKGKERRKDYRVELIHIRLSLPPGAITPAHVLARLPASLQSTVGFIASNIIAPIVLHLAFASLQYFNLDQASARLRLPEQPRSESRSRSRSRSRSKTRRHLTGRSHRQEEKEEDPLSRPPFSLVPSVPPLHVELPVPKPSKDEREALEILQRRSTSPPSPSSSSPVLRPTPEAISQRFYLSSISKEALLAFLTLPISLISALVFEFSSLYYLIARIVVLFTEVVLAAGGVLKETVVVMKEEKEGVVGLGFERVEKKKERMVKERLERISEIEEEESEEHIVGSQEKVEVAEPKEVKPSVLDRVAIARGSPPLSPTPPIYHHPRLRGKRVSFPSLFATVIGQSVSSPQVSLPPSPSHSPAPPPPPPPPSISDSPETMSILEVEEPRVAVAEEPEREEEEYPADPRMYNLPSLATADTPEALLHFKASQEAAAVGSEFQSVLALPEHGIDRGQVGEKELKVWDKAGKEASELGRDLSTEVRMQVAVEELEDDLEKKKEDFIEKSWNGESKEEGVFGGEEEDLERRRLKNLVGKEVAEVANERLRKEEEEAKLLEIEKVVEERRKKMVEEALEIEREMAEAVEGNVEGEGEGEEASRSFHTAISSASDYPTPSSRLSDQPVADTSSFEPASPTESASSASSAPSTSVGPVPSPLIPTQAISPSAEGSPPTSPEISRGRSSNVGKVEKPQEAAESSGPSKESVAVEVSSSRATGGESGVGGAEGAKKSGKSKSKKKKGKK